MNENINKLLNKLSDNKELLCGFHNGEIEPLDLNKLIKIYALDSKVWACTDEGREYILRLRLYEAEERLNDNFIRISNSEIVNIRKCKKFDLSYKGTISVLLSDGSISYVSRRYVSKIKKVLGL